MLQLIKSVENTIHDKAFHSYHHISAVYNSMVHRSFSVEQKEDKYWLNMKT